MAHAETIAQLALGGGWECTIIISNKTASERTGDFWMKSGNDRFWPVGWSVNGEDFSDYDGFWVTIKPNGTFKAVVTASSTLNMGYLEYFARGSASSSDVVVSYFYGYRSNGVLQTTAGSARVDSHRGFEFPVEKSYNTDTGFAWAPWITTTSFPISLTLYDKQGNVFRRKTVNYTGHKSIFFSQIFDGVPANFLGKVRITAPDFFYLEVLRFDWTASGFQLTSTPPDWFVP